MVKSNLYYPIQSRLHRTPTTTMRQISAEERKLVSRDMALTVDVLQL